MRTKGLLIKYSFVFFVVFFMSCGDKDNVASNDDTSKLQQMSALTDQLQVCIADFNVNRTNENLEKAGDKLRILSAKWKEFIISDKMTTKGLAALPSFSKATDVPMFYIAANMDYYNGSCTDEVKEIVYSLATITGLMLNYKDETKDVGYMDECIVQNYVYFSERMQLLFPKLYEKWNEHNN